MIVITYLMNIKFVNSSNSFSISTACMQTTEAVINHQGSSCGICQLTAAVTGVDGSMETTDRLNLENTGFSRVFCTERMHKNVFSCFLKCIYAL